MKIDFNQHDHTHVHEEQPKDPEVQKLELKVVALLGVMFFGFMGYVAKRAMDAEAKRREEDTISED